MTIPPDNLEKKVDNILHYLKIQTRKRWLRRAAYTSLGALAIAAGIWSYTSRHQKEEPPKSQIVEKKQQEGGVQKEDKTGSPRIPPLEKQIEKAAVIPPPAPLTYNTITSAQFQMPFTLEFTPQFYKKNKTSPVMYVFDAADRSIHRFSNTEPTYAVGRYNPPLSLDGKRKKRGEKQDFLSLYYAHFPYSERLKGLVPFLIDNQEKEVLVDYMDGTIVTFTLPDLLFKKREVGGKRNAKKYGRGALQRHVPTVTYCDERIKKEVDKYLELNADYAVYSMLKKFSGQPQELFNPQEKSFTANFVQECRSPLSAQTLERLNLIVRANGTNYDVETTYHEYAGEFRATASFPTSLMRGKDHLIQQLLYHYFSKREFVLGQQFWAAPESYVLERVQTQLPTHYIHYNDSPSRFTVSLSKVIPFEASTTKRIGACGYGPVIAFDDLNNQLLFGYICDNGDIEPHLRLSYNQIDVTSATSSHIIDRVHVGNRMYYLEQGIPRVKMIEIKNGN